ncbi:MAG: phosphatase [Burkholderiales bacterium]
MARAARRGVTTLALTDHDETRGLAEARVAAGEQDITLVGGVEISVTWHGHTLHVVGLHIDPENRELAVGLELIRSGRRLRAEAMAESLRRAGIAGSLEGARSYAGNPELVARTHFARFLVERGHAREVAAVFKKYLAVGKPGHVPHQWAGLEQSVAWIKAAGGVPVLAHPGRYRLGNAQRDALLADFRDAGGIAIEVVTASHAAQQFATWARQCRRFGLLASAGSDFHGPGESRCDLGGLPALPDGCTPVWSRF